MSKELIFSSLRRRKSSLSGVFFAPADLSDVALIKAVASVASNLIAKYADPPVFQLRNARSLVRKVKVLLFFLQFLGDCGSSSWLPPSAKSCLKELYILIHRARVFLDFCSQASQLWLLLQNPQISGHFHDLDMEIATLLDVFPLRQIGMAADVREQMELLRLQCQRSKLFVDPRDEALRFRIFSFLDEFEMGRAPEPSELRMAFVHRLGIQDEKACLAEIEYLEEQIHSQDEDADPCLVGAAVALVRYCRFRLFEIKQVGEETKKIPTFKWTGESSVTIPKDFCCPISLDLMRDPVIVSSAHAQSSFAKLDCPLVRGAGNPYDAPDGYETSAETTSAASASKAATEANRKTAEILIGKLSAESESERTAAAREIRLLAKTGMENRACIAELGAIPLLEALLSSNSIAQENSVTAILNLSIHENNKRRIMEQGGCLRSIVGVLTDGFTSEARENAAATLFSLSAVHVYKKRISDEEGAVVALAKLLREGTPRGKKDAVTTLFNLSTHPECSARMVESGAVSALVEALKVEGVADEAAGALALLARQKNVVDLVGKDDAVLGNLIGLMRIGGAKGKENAVAALHELCRSGGMSLTLKVAKTPALASLIHTVLFTGTKRARRKAVSLIRLCQMFEPAVGTATPPSAAVGL
ncbi:hypothetical protein HPP92_007786 [Vanilla planifolia]|uniref:RING-type E3 ubiquitin transferase n=1 Tax=Vanilla planifolia TaxID=51239 RepID=A0A835RB30_VANPL|nr:hypothetical protein HPP92_007786 [Vanilla planifolia]